MRWKDDGDLPGRGLGDRSQPWTPEQPQSRCLHGPAGQTTAAVTPPRRSHHTGHPATLPAPRAVLLAQPQPEEATGRSRQFGRWQTLRSCVPVPESCIWATGGLSPIFPSTARTLARISSSEDTSKLVLQGIHRIHLNHPPFIIYYLSSVIYPHIRRLCIIYHPSTHPSVHPSIAALPKPEVLPVPLPLQGPSPGPWSGRLGSGQPGSWAPTNEGPS